MAKQGLVTLAQAEDLVWDRLETATGSFRIARPFTSRECPTIGGGLVELEGTELAWTPNYDEIVTVLAGELTIRHGGEELTARAGELFLIRYGAEIVYQAQQRCVFSWVLSPATWRNLRWPE